MTGRKAFKALKNGKTAPDFRIVRLAAPVRLALQGLAALAREPEAFFDTTALARRLGLPAASLSKCFQALARFGLLAGRRGPGGGYRLAQDPANVTLSAVAAALRADRGQPRLCLMEDHPCAEAGPCRLHSVALAANSLVGAELMRLTLVDLI